MRPRRRGSGRAAIFRGGFGSAGARPFPNVGLTRGDQRHGGSERTPHLEITITVQRIAPFRWDSLSFIVWWGFHGHGEQVKLANYAVLPATLALLQLHKLV